MPRDSSHAGVAHHECLEPLPAAPRAVAGSFCKEGAGMPAESLQAIWFRFKHQGDVRARETLIENYSYLVKITAGRVASGVPPSLDREDLISAGVIGLIRAVDQFDSSREVKFETYA